MSYYDNSKELDQIADLQATIADLQGQLKAAKAPRMYDCGSCAIGKGFEQRVAQLEGELKRYAGCGHDHSTAWWQLRCEDMENDKVILQRHLQESAEQLGKLQAAHARVLGLVQALPVVQNVSYMQAHVRDGVQCFGLVSAVEELLKYRASLPAQPAQGPVKKCPVNCLYCNDPDYGHPGHK